MIYPEQNTLLNGRGLLDDCLYSIDTFIDGEHDVEQVFAADSVRAPVFYPGNFKGNG